MPGPGTVAGFVVGIVIGFGGALLTDLAIGAEVEEGVRVGMGERGCRPRPSAISPAPFPRLYACFPGDAHVLLADGTERTISAMQAGDEVLAYDEETDDFRPCTVDRVHRHPSKDLVRLNFEDGPHLDVTREHPVRTARGWIPASALEHGDTLYRHVEGALQPVTLARISHQPARGSVYTLTVTDCHTFVVDGMVVHNK